VTFAYAGLESVEIPDGVTEIKHQAFAECKELTLCKIPDSVQTISDRAFENSPNVVIVASEGSYAAQYAAEQGIPFQAA
ncbi:MAG: leucine-rich repeat domain-containing protein, partial [Oscillospiraceae bacterium]|nr:leucine-rich repeat domain-containing protein [Oscillospiraceae bacterium]